uniref:Uncharacterized protein n=1 Tax=viral metagenome TaxID=1070528 RepID=A0A6H1Z725_9ZZZZ
MGYRVGKGGNIYKVKGKKGKRKSGRKTYKTKAAAKKCKRRRG